MPNFTGHFGNVKEHAFYLEAVIKRFIYHVLLIEVD